jgi:hypothetical protein
MLIGSLGLVSPVVAGDAGAVPEPGDHWSFQPCVRPGEPALRNWAWVRNSIDMFILARLEAEGVAPAPEADRATLLRRLSLDLIGLPPSPKELDAFLNDTDDDAYDKVVDRLLASPHFGERWGRHWLDLARYADSDGYEKDRPRPHAWRYRNWVIDAVNRDLPFDRFTIEQLAGDLLPNRTQDQLIATGFHRNTLTNTEGGTDKEEDRVKQTVDRVNTTGTVWLGLTVMCGQCHTHKYDPLEHREFYQLFAFFNSLEEVDIPAALPAETARYEKAKAEYDKAHAPLVAAVDAYKPVLRKSLAEWEQQLGPVDVKWTPLEPVGFVSAGGASFSIGDDQSITVGGNKPQTDTYSVVVTTREQGINAFRLEVLTDASLPKNGPGRSEKGDFVLSELTVQASPLSDPSESVAVKLASASADHAEKDFPVAAAIDDKPETGWSIGESKTDINVSRAAEFITAAGVGLDAGTTLTFTLSQQQSKQQTIGRFRLSTSTAGRKMLAIPAPVRDALAVASDQRSDERKAVVFDYVGTIDPKMIELNKAVATHAKTMPRPPDTKAQTLAEKSEPRKTHIHVRGDFLRKGDEVRPTTPAVLHAFAPRDENQPTRLDLAHWLVNPENPLTPRVAANRIWQHLFGVGIVPTTEDFGLRGDPPSHPKLLDWLAGEMIERGWSTKEMIRLIVRSATYRQSSQARPELDERDPKNRLLARQNRFRLSAEIVRDSFLASSGLLHRAIGGPSIRPPLPADVAKLGYANSVQWAESKGKDRYRRGMYIFYQRTVPYPMLATFDTPDSNTTCTRRERSNTPLQALTLLNDPVFVECAQSLAYRVLSDAGKKGTDERIRHAYRLCLGRDPTAQEHARVTHLLAEMRELCKADPKGSEALLGACKTENVDVAEAAAWVTVARTLLNLDELIVRE